MHRILHYVGKMDIGGMEAIIMSLYRTIDRSQWQFDFAVHSEKEGFYEEEIRCLGGRIYRFPPMRQNPLAYKSAWERFWVQHKEEYYAFQMHTNSLANCIALQAANKAGIEKIIVHAHSAYANKGKLQILGDCLHYINRSRLDKLANTLIACSPEAAEWVFGRKRLDNNSVSILKNGVDFEKYRYSDVSRKTIREELGIINQIVFLQIGHLLPVKNHAFSLKLMKELKQLGYNPVLLIAGDGTEKERLYEIVNNLGINQNVVFLGVRSDVKDLLSGADYYLMPSLYEGMPLSAIEAQVSGIHCLLSDTITKEVQISNRVEFLSIKNTFEWVSSVINSKDVNANRLNVSCDNSFNIDYITNRYISLID